MCLALPGRIVEMLGPGAEPDAGDEASEAGQTSGRGGLPFARVEFGSVTREVCLAYTPEARVGDYVIVHVGFAIQLLDEQAARRTLDLLHQEPGILPGQDPGPPDPEGGP